MKDREYILLKSMLEKNRELFKKGDYNFLQYLDNHKKISKKLKKSILVLERILHKWL